MKIFSAVLIAVLLPSSAALAWSRSGHMLTAAIAYEDLQTQAPEVVEQIAALLEKHPEHAPFEVAAGNTTGAERAKRLFLEMARWPDDTRGGIHDHPTWHYTSLPLIDPAAPPGKKPKNVPQGSASEAFALSLSVATNSQASAGERAVALCWLAHLLGDIHQPLHTLSQFSSRFPDGDQGGGLQYILDPQTNRAVTLHWYWDDGVIRETDPDALTRRALEMRKHLPRAALAELKQPNNIDFALWSDESFQIAREAAYVPELKTGDAAANATKLPQKYIERSSAIMERRATLAGYRLADVLKRVFGDDAR